MANPMAMWWMLDHMSQGNLSRTRADLSFLLRGQVHFGPWRPSEETPLVLVCQIPRDEDSHLMDCPGFLGPSLAYSILLLLLAPMIRTLDPLDISISLFLLFPPRLCRRHALGLPWCHRLGVDVASSHLSWLRPAILTMMNVIFRWSSIKFKNFFIEIYLKFLCIYPWHQMLNATFMKSGLPIKKWIHLWWSIYFVFVVRRVKLWHWFA